jgi:heat shock protein HslJ
MKRCLILMLPFALAACAKTPQGEPATPPAAVAPAATQAAPADTTALTAYHWRLNDAKDASGKRIDALFVNADKPLQLDFAGGRISVSNTCNHMGGAYSVEGDKLKFDRLASTLMACADPKLMALDQEIGKRLEGESTFALQPGDAPILTLTGGNGDVLTFKGDPTAETRYGGKGETTFLEVAAQTKPCSHPLIPNKQCLQVREIKYDDQGIKTGSDGEFQNFYEGIEGYTHEAGIRNVLRVKRYKRDPVPADAASIVYVLDMVVESETVKP